MILLGDLLCAQVFLYRHRVVRAALDGRIVGDDDAVQAFDDSDSREDARRERVVAVHVEGRERRELEKIRTWIDQPFGALARGELIAAPMLFDRRGSASGANGDQPLPQLGD